MKTALFSFIASCFITLTTAQKIHLTDSTNTWEVLHYHEGGGGWTADPFHLSFSGDTVVAGITYKRMVNPYPNLTYNGGLFREDTLADKAWCRHIVHSIGDNDTAEHLIYNGGWQAGDTLAAAHGYYSVITGVDSVSIDNRTYKRFHFRTPGSTYQEWDLLEGIGAIGGPAFPAYPYTFEDQWRLKCFTSKGDHPQVSPTVNFFGYFFDNNLSCTLDVTASQPSSDQAIVYPNPFSDVYNVRHLAGFTGASVTMSDALGRPVLSRQMGNTDLKINTAGYAAGVYFLKLQSESVRQLVKVILTR